MTAVVAAVMVALAAWYFIAQRADHQSVPAGNEPSTLVTTLRSEPATFNRYTAPGRAYPTALVNGLTQAPLVRINRMSDQLEPWLAESWEVSADNLQYDLLLREGVRFSDGEPFTSADVVFSFAAIYDPKTASPFADLLRIGGRPLVVEAKDDRRVTIRFPAPYGPGLRLLDGIPIYPRHRLKPYLDAGTLAEAWGPATPPSEIVGLGPFRLERYEPGQRLIFTRNPHYWRTDGNGKRYPRLERIVAELVPDQNAELLRLQAGQIDLMQSELRPEDYGPLKAEADRGRLKMIDIGTSLDTHLLWFNLTGTARENGRPWLHEPAFRRAVSHAVDRRRFAETVYLGAAEPTWTLVSPANATWRADIPEPVFDRDLARSLLGSLQLTDPDGDGMLQDPSGAPVRFTILVQKGITAAEKGAWFIRDELTQVGIGVDVAALELSALMSRWSKAEYDAIYHWMMWTDTDPAGNQDLWLSSGSAHLWNPGQTTPATEWERQVDALMRQQVASTDLGERQRLFAEVQRIVAEQSPALVFATPHVYVATSTRVSGYTPAVSRPQILWNPDVVTVQ
ncbi:MAG TPA: ABC transporter substrate-binding protein [Vicinamibacterales bacterium]|nr:ABC transporter substrate-binding protein [Vicinamibacterales bacterium]